MPTRIACQVAAIAFFVISLSGFAQAATITETRTFNGLGDTPLSFDGFDSSLGTLNSVSATLSGIATLPPGTISGTPIDIGFGTFVFDRDFSLFVSTSRFFFPLTASVNGIYQDCFGMGPGLCTINYSGRGNVSYGRTAFARSSVLPLLSQSWQTTIEVSTFFQGRGGTVTSGPTSNWSTDGRLTVQYNYTPAPVPLPAGLPLILAGMGVFALLKRPKPS